MISSLKVLNYLRLVANIIVLLLLNDSNTIIFSNNAIDILNICFLLSVLKYRYIKKPNEDKANIIHAARLPLIRITKKSGISVSHNHLYLFVFWYMTKKQKTESIEHMCAMVFLG